VKGEWGGGRCPEGEREKALSPMPSRAASGGPPDGPGGPGDLPSPRSETGRAGLAALLRAPARGLIALDYDGTLAPIVSDPMAARPHRGAAAALHRLAPLVGTLAVITGRPAAEAVGLGGLDQIPGLIVLGNYGRQRWEGGTLTAPPAPPGVATARRELPAVLAAAGDPAEGAWAEDKGDALAVHTRLAAEPQRALDLLRAPLAELAARTGLAVQPGRLVIELRPPGGDKGVALKDLRAERGSRAVMFGGDDLGDGPAFEAVAELRADGIPGLAVCSGSQEVTALDQLADLVVDGPDGVVALLDSLAAAMAAPA
jgi:trehalose 6-phosphate phosphatase